MRRTSWGDEVAHRILIEVDERPISSGHCTLMNSLADGRHGSTNE